MGVLFTDNFTRADAPELGVGWRHERTHHLATGFVISGNKAVPAQPGVDDSGSNCMVPVALHPDHYATATYASTSASGLGGGSGVICRSGTGTVASTLTGYRLVGNASGYELLRFINGAATSLSSGAGTTFTASDSITLEVRQNGAGVDWTCQKNGTTFASGNDAAGLQPGRYGIAFSTNGTTADALSAFAGGDFVTTNVPKIRSRGARQIVHDEVYDGGHFNECNIKTWF